MPEKSICVRLPRRARQGRLDWEESDTRNVQGRASSATLGYSSGAAPDLAAHQVRGSLRAALPGARHPGRASRRSLFAMAHVRLVLKLWRLSLYAGRDVVEVLTKCRVQSRGDVRFVAAEGVQQRGLRRVRQKPGKWPSGKTRRKLAKRLGIPSCLLCRQ
jgi:hypothetical protein